MAAPPAPDLGDVMRWAGEQNARQIEDFRYRIIDGRESVSFRLVPDYAIRVRTHDIIVVAHARLQAGAHSFGYGAA